MNKDDYAMMKVRQDLATAFVNKIGEMKVQDLDLLPAIIDYVKTGDISVFKEYERWHFTKTNEEKLEQSRNSQEELEKQKANYERFYVDYCRYVEDYNKWRKEIVQQEWLQEQESVGDDIGVQDLARFIEEKGFNNGYNKKLYVRDDNGKLRPVKALTTFNKRANTTVAVMELGDSIFKLQSPPRMDEFTRRKRGLDYLPCDPRDIPF